jgi:hypothetical protein
LASDAGSGVIAAGDVCVKKEGAMSTVVLGPAYRQIATALGKAADEVRAEIKKVTNKISKKLKGQRKAQFDSGTMENLKTPRRLRGALRTLTKIMDDIDAGQSDLSAKEEAELLSLLWALIDMLRSLGVLENAVDHYGSTATGWGY